MGFDCLSSLLDHCLSFYFSYFDDKKSYVILKCKEKRKNRKSNVGGVLIPFIYKI